jgi:translation initiation factor IF-1
MVRFESTHNFNRLGQVPGKMQTNAIRFLLEGKEVLQVTPSDLTKGSKAVRRS